MTVSADYLAYVIEQLAELGGVSSRRMFGGAGLYCEEFFFGLIADRRLLATWAARSVAVARSVSAAAALPAARRTGRPVAPARRRNRRRL